MDVANGRLLWVPRQQQWRQQQQQEGHRGYHATCTVAPVVELTEAVLHRRIVVPFQLELLNVIVNIDSQLGALSCRPAALVSVRRDVVPICLQIGQAVSCVQNFRALAFNDLDTLVIISRARDGMVNEPVHLILAAGLVADA